MRLGSLGFLELLDFLLVEEAVLVEVGFLEFLHRVGRQFGPVDHPVLVGVDFLELDQDELLAHVVGQLALRLRTVGGTGGHEIFLLADPAVVVLVELVGVAHLQADEVVQRHQALAALGFRLLPLGRLPLRQALHDQADLRLGDLVVTVGIVLIELGLDRSFRFGVLDEAAAVGVEVLEGGAQAIAPLLQVRSARNIARMRWLGQLEEFIERHLAVLAGLEVVERFDAVLQEVGAQNLALLGGVDLDEPGRQRHRCRTGGLGLRQSRQRQQAQQKYRSHHPILSFLGLPAHS